MALQLICHYVNEGILQQVLPLQDHLVGNLSTDVFKHRCQLELYAIVSEAFLVDPPHQNYYQIALIFINIILLTG